LRDDIMLLELKTAARAFGSAPFVVSGRETKIPPFARDDSQNLVKESFSGVAYWLRLF
jgi:hypothetical protein